jgi:hypothetical protein
MKERYTIQTVTGPKTEPGIPKQETTVLPLHPNFDASLPYCIYGTNI